MKRFVRLLAFLSVWSVAIVLEPAVYAQPQPAPKSNVTAKQLTREQMEQFLLNARIVGERAAPKGITHTKRIVLTDGTYVHDAHVQTINEFKPEVRLADGKIEKNFKDSYKFNIAAYRLDKMMDLGVVPVCVYRVVDGQPAAVDWWVDDVMFDEEGRRDKDVDPPDGNSWTKQLNIVRDFDQLIYNDDRNQGNLLIDRDWKLWAIDHSRAFRDNTTLRNPDVLRRISQKMLDSLKALDEKSLEANLLPFLTIDDIQTMLVRRDLLVRFFQDEINTKGPDTVLLDIPRHTQYVTIP